MKPKVIRALFPIFLAGLAVSSSHAHEPVTAEPAAYKVAEVWLGAISPDGRFLSYTDWSTGDLAVQDLKIGESRRLTQKGSWASPEFAQALHAISPDGKHVAYGWQGTSCDLRLVALDGSEPRILYRNEDIAVILPEDWSRDGQHILASFWRKDSTGQIVLVSVPDGSLRVLKTFDEAVDSSPVNMAFSSDGRFIVYDFPPNEKSSERDIYLLPVDGSRGVPLVEHTANDFVLGWAPDGNWVLFASDRAGTLGAWGIRVVDGQPRGLPTLVKSEIPPIGNGSFTRDGSYYYAHSVWVNDVYTATVDPVTGRAQRPHKLVSHVGPNTSAEWSPDGHYLAYASGMGRYPDPFVLGIRSLETGEEHRLRLEMTRLGGHAFQPQWSPDGRALLGSGRLGIHRMDAHTGEVTLLVDTPGGCPGSGDCIEWPVWASDGRAIFTRRGSQGLPRRIVARELESGQEEELYRANPPAAVSQLTVSADGRRLAFVWSELPAGTSALKAMPTAAGREPLELTRAPRPEGNIRLFELRTGVILRPAWSSDGRHVLFATVEAAGQGQRFELWRISSDGGEPESLGLAMEGLLPYGLSVHPDGRRIAFTAGTPNRQETWVMENLLVPAITGDATVANP